MKKVVDDLLLSNSMIYGNSESLLRFIKEDDGKSILSILNNLIAIIKRIEKDDALQLRSVGIFKRRFALLLDQLSDGKKKLNKLKKEINNEKASLQLLKKFLDKSDNGRVLSKQLFVIIEDNIASELDEIMNKFDEINKKVEDVAGSSKSVEKEFERTILLSTFLDLNKKIKFLVCDIKFHFLPAIKLFQQALMDTKKI